MTTEKTAANGKAAQTTNQAPAQSEDTITVLKKENPYGEGTVRWGRHAIIVRSKTVAEAFEPYWAPTGKCKLRGVPSRLRDRPSDGLNDRQNIV